MSEKIPNDHTDPMWKTHMETLMKRMRQTEISDTIDKALFEWYFERGLEVPNWKVQKDPDWWREYLKELDETE
jgi:type III secretory pathway component EscV